MEKLDCMNVHGNIPSDPNLASPSLATSTICAKVSDVEISQVRDALFAND